MRPWWQRGARFRRALSVRGRQRRRRQRAGSSGDTRRAEGKVGVILPDETTSPRWEANDRPSLQAAFDDAGVDLQRHGCHRVSDVLGLTSDEVLAWRGIGLTKYQRMLAVLRDIASSAAMVRAAAVVLDEDYDLDGDHESQAVPESDERFDPDLGILSDWAFFVDGARTWGQVHTVLLGGGLPPDVLEALHAVGERPSHASTGRSATDRLSAWIEGLDLRDRDILAFNCSHIDKNIGRPGSRSRITRERVRQLEAKAAARFRQTFLEVPVGAKCGGQSSL